MPSRVRLSDCIIKVVVRGWLSMHSSLLWWTLGVLHRFLLDFMPCLEWSVDIDIHDMS
jgi:hypothetical protein